MRENILIKHLKTVAVPRHPDFDSLNYLKIRQYIKDEFSKYGEVKIHTFTYGRQTHENIILDLPGQENASPIIIGAHYDGVANSPGADDNATGVAALFPLAEEFSQNSLKYPLRLIAFDMEEAGMVGSKYYVDALDEPIKLMISLEMLGYCNHKAGSQEYPEYLASTLTNLFGDRGNYMVFVGNELPETDIFKLREICNLSVKTFALTTKEKGLDLPASRLSDHSPFWDREFPAAIFTDTAFMRNPHYHLPSDTIENLDLKFYFQVVEGLINSLKGVYGV